MESDTGRWSKRRCDSETSGSALAHATVESALGADEPGVRGAANHGENEIAWKTPVALASFFELRKPWADWITAGQIAVDAARCVGDLQGEAWVLNGLCAPYRGLGRLDDSLDCLRRSLHIRSCSPPRRYPAPHMSGPSASAMPGRCWS
jgi:hypothetical protein